MFSLMEGIRVPRASRSGLNLVEGEAKGGLRGELFNALMDLRGLFKTKFQILIIFLIIIPS